MAKEEKEDIIKDLNLIAENIRRCANIAIILFWRNVRSLAHLIFNFSKVAYDLIVAFLAPTFLISFGIEIIFFANLGLGWKLIGCFLFIIGLSLVCFFLYSLFFEIKLNNKKDLELTEDSAESNAIFWFTAFSIVSLVIIRMMSHPILGFNFFQKYNFKFPVLEKIQTNVDYLLVSFPVFFLFLVLLSIFTMPWKKYAVDEKEEDGEKISNETDDEEKKAQSIIIKP